MRLLTINIGAVLGLVIGLLPVMGRGEGNPFQDWTAEQLVAQLRVEREIDRLPPSRPDFFYRHDRIVGELIRRQDVESVRILIDGLNDETVVEREPEERGCWTVYDTPVRVQDKVRFVLRYLLSTSEFQAIVGDWRRHVVDIKNAQREFEIRRADIAKRMQVEKSYGPAPTTK